MAPDYIIVGAGPAGCVLAARLSEDPTVSVLLLEAGGRDLHPLFHIPAGFAKMTKGIGSWGWSTVPQHYLGGRTLRYTQAKVLGGGSSINAQVYTRGHRADYDAWSDEEGCAGWSYAELLPYFMRSEDNDRFLEPYHGRGGPIGVSAPVNPLPISEAFIAAARQYGLPANSDFNGARQEGVGHYQLTVRKARRSSAVSYLRQARGRKNLAIRVGAPALRIVVEKGRAVGVEIGAANRARETIFCAREILIAAGAIGSPRLLLLSGVGPADHLRRAGVEVVHDLPGVGENLQDHLDLYVICECTGDHSYDGYARWHRTLWAGARYLALRRGPAASTLFETGGFGFSAGDVDRPDIQFHLGLGSGIEAGVERLRHAGVTLNSAFLRPRSRGSVRLAGPDPAVAPLIDPNYWAEPEDRAASLAGLRMAREIMAQPALRPFILAERAPGPSVASDDDLAAYARRTCKTDHHPAGTCKMGVDAMAVVGPDLRVRGLEALRVCDSSIMPRVTSSNTNAPTLMIGEKAADLVRGRPAPPPVAFRDKRFD